MAAQIDAFGLDLGFEDATGLVLGADGDLALAGGLDTYQQHLLHALLSEPGSVPYAPTAGGGAERFEGGPPLAGRELERRVRATLAADPDTLAVTQVVVAQDAAQGVTYCSAAVTTRAAPADTTPLTFDLGSSR